MTEPSPLRLLAAGALAVGVTALVPAPLDGAPANGHSTTPAVSADGRYVAFESRATNLDRAALPRRRNVFVRDLRTGRVELVSRAGGRRGAGGVGDSVFPSISANGRYVAFHSGANNLSRIDENRWINVFVRDRRRGRTILVSRRSRADGGAGARGGHSVGGAISADGHHVAFVSTSRNLADGGPRGEAQVYVRDLRRGRTILVSRASGRSGEVGEGSASRPAISANGRYVAFVSRAGNLVAEPVPANASQIYVRDLVTHRTVLASRQSAAKGDAPVGRDALNPSISGDGRRVAFDTAAGDLPGADVTLDTDVYVRDLATSTTRAASRRAPAGSGAWGDGASAQPALSPDGRFVAFESTARNLGAAAGRSAGDDDYFVYMKDLRTGAVRVASRERRGREVGFDGRHGRVAISSGGRVVVFERFAPGVRVPLFRVYARDIARGRTITASARR